MADKLKRPLSSRTIHRAVGLILKMKERASKMKDWEQWSDLDRLQGMVGSRLVNDLWVEGRTLNRKRN